MFFGAKQNQNLEEFANALAKCVSDMFLERNNIKFSEPPKLEKKSIIEYNGRMRAEGMEKFNDPTFISAINYYLNAQEMEKKKAIGTIVTYIEQKYVVQLLKLLKYPPVDDEDLDALADCCGTLCNIIAGAFKTAIANMGYKDLEMSHFMSYRNKAVTGVDFCYNERDKYTLSFSIKDEKRLVIEMTIGVIPKA